MQHFLLIVQLSSAILSILICNFLCQLTSAFVVVLCSLTPTAYGFSILALKLRWLNTVLAVREYVSFAKSSQEKGCCSQAETWQVKNILMKDFG